MGMQDQVTREACGGGRLDQFVGMQNDGGTQSALEFPFDDPEDLPAHQPDAETRSIRKFAVQKKFEGEVAGGGVLRVDARVRGADGNLPDVAALQ